MKRLRPLTKSDYVTLAGFRAELRRFLAVTEANARSAGLTARQHQLLLAIKGRPDADRATIGELAEALQIRHHTAVGLTDRCARRGLVRRSRVAGDGRKVEVGLTPRGERVLARVSAHNRAELEALRRSLDLTRLRERSRGRRPAHRRVSRA